MRFLMTGATGTVGAPTVLALLARGHEVVALVRAKEGITPEERLQKALSIPTLPEGLFVLPGDIEIPGCGVNSQDLERWGGAVDAVLHLAASTKFNDDDGSLFHTNVEGTRHVLELVHHGVKAGWFYYVSTTYVIGSASALSEDGEFGQGPRNKYEESKIAAERSVRACPMSSIIRIPIVVGNSATGETSQFEGYYGFFKAFWELRRMILEMWQKYPAQCLACGIRVDEDRNIHAPFQIPCSAVGPLQLMPVDWVAEMIARIMEIPGGGQTFHLVHPRPLSVREVIRISLEHLGFRDMIIGESFPLTHPLSHYLLRMLQDAILKGIKPYEPYTSKDEEAFSDEQTRRIIERTWREPPAVDAAFLRRTLDWAIQSGFGRS